jgi:hypothetical protein
MYKVSGGAYLAWCSSMDVLRYFVQFALSPPRRFKILMLALCLLVYLSFHRVRLLLPDGFIRSSLPSVLLMPVMFGVTDLFSSIRYHSFSWKVLITLAATIFFTIWFEWVVPEFASRSTSDLADVAAMFIGWLFYIGLDLALAKRT